MPVLQLGAGLIAVGSAADRSLVDQLVRSVWARYLFFDLCGRTSLIQLAALAAESTLVISNDTGPLHLAAAADARVVGIYTCTSPALTGPFGTRVATVQSCVWCAPQLRQEMQPTRLHGGIDSEPHLADCQISARTDRLIISLRNGTPPLDVPFEIPHS